MMRRFREVSLRKTQSEWIDHQIFDYGQHKDTSLAPNFVEYGGGQSFAGANSFMVHWKVIDNVAEVRLEGMSDCIGTHNVRITCNTQIVGRLNFALVNNELTVMLASLCSVHIVTFDTSKLKKQLTVGYSDSHVVSIDCTIAQCSAISTEDFGIVFSLTSEFGHLFAVAYFDGKYEEMKLQQTSLIGSIWNKVRRSMASGPVDDHLVVSSAISDEHPSIYCLTTGLQIQQWAIGSWECLRTYNLLNFVTVNQRAKGLCVKFFSACPNSLLGVAISDGNQSKIVLLKLSEESGHLVDCVMVADCSLNQLISFELVDELLFILWRNREDVYELVHLAFSDSEPKFKKCLLDSPVLSSVEVENWEEPREKYTDHIFCQTKISKLAVARAILMLDPDNRQLPDDIESCSVKNLKQITWNAITNQVRKEVSADEATNAEYRQLQIDVWEKFYINVAQYNQVDREPLGLVGGCADLPITLVSKGGVSYLRPCEPLEQQVLFPSDRLDNAAYVNQDVVSIMQAAFLLQDCVEGFEDHIYLAVVDSDVVSEAFDQILHTITRRSDHAIIKNRFSTYIQNIHMLHEGLTVFIHLLNVVNQIPEDSPTTTTAGGDNPFSSINERGQSIICSSVHDVAETRYKLCCRLVLFLQYLGRLNEEVSRSEEMRGEIDELLTTLHSLLRAYAVVVWICRLNTTSESQLDMNTAMMDVLRISNGDNMDKTLSMVTTSPSEQTPSLIRFLTGMGGVRVQALVQPTVNKLDYYEYLSALIIATCQTVWPETTDVLFPEFLLAATELSALQGYCSLLEGHCKASASSRKFLLGQTYLLEREPEKAYFCFQEALYGMFEEAPTAEGEELIEQTISQQEQFCFKVINMFEEFAYSEQVIQMSHQTLKLPNTHQSKLVTKIFKHNLELRHYDDAFKAILANGDNDSKMDCLHQFISTLCERGELKTLASYPYKDIGNQQDLRPAVVSILLRKARSVDLTMKNYYDLLYAFHVINNDMLSAANVMYECCERLSCELSGLAALRKKAKCLVACIHSLQCVPIRSAWIAPASLTERKYMPGRGALSKRTSQGNHKAKSLSQVKILSLEDIEKEYLLVNMALRLAANGSKQTGSTYLDPSEIVALLCNIGMYDEAIEVCTAYSLSLSPIFESLTFRCVRMSRETDNDKLSEVSEESKKWLTYNRLPTETSYSNSCDQAWKILRHYLQKHDLVSTKYHKVVANKLLVNSSSLPEWLISSYKYKNVAEIIRLYLQYDIIEDAVSLTVEFLTALTGPNFDRFGLENSLSATMNSSSVWVPYTSLDTLLKVLEEHRQDSYYMQLYNKLNEAINQYITDLEEKSEDALRKQQSIRQSSRQITGMNWA